LAPTLAFSCAVATIVVVIGVRDLESYEHAFFSLDRGTAIQTERVLGHPVYTLSLGLGVRLPLHGSLGASPAAALGGYLPIPVTYALLLIFAIASAVMVVRHALEPMCGRFVSWWAVSLLVLSLPLVNYTISDDWPETAVTYCAAVACVFAPHALLGLADSQPSAAWRRAGLLLLAGVVSSLLAVSHPGYWPLLAITLVCAFIVALCRTDYPLRRRVMTVAALAVASFMPVAMQAPDILRETGLAANQVSRLVQGPAGGLLFANLFPFVGHAAARMPFTNLALAVVALVIGLRSHRAVDRRLVVVSALISALLGLGAAMVTPGSSVYAPSNTWALRDPAAAFGVMAGAWAARVVMRWPPRRQPFGAWPALAVLAVASLQGPLYAIRVLSEQLPTGRSHSWTQDLASPARRVARRGLVRDLAPPGERLALWTGTRSRLRQGHESATDFADAGYPLVTAETKDRTMRGLVEPNGFLFNQSTDLAPEILCNAIAVQFLRLRYLLTPPAVTCEPWTTLPGLLVDDWLEVKVVRERDRMVRALPVARLSTSIAQKPALSPHSSLLSALEPMPGTALSIEPHEMIVQQEDVGRSRDRAMVLPVAYDSGWRASSGRLQNVGGLLALVNVDRPRVVLRFVPDAVAISRAIAMTVAQVLACVGLIGLAMVRSRAIDEAVLAHERAAADAVRRHVSLTRAVVLPPLRRALSAARSALREPQNLLCLLFSAAVIARPQRADQIDLFTALLLPLTTLAVARAAHWRWLRGWIGMTVLAAALVRVALAGSRAAEALHDPLFWGIVAFVCAGVAVFTGRWPVIAIMVSMLAGGTAAVATLLPNLPNFAVALPQIDLGVIGGSLTAISDQLGSVASVFVFALWLHAIAFTWRYPPDRVGTGARGALLMALLLCLTGALPIPPIANEWIVGLGLLVGLTNPRSAL
jgi:hypothetical protein